ncbi:MAG: ATP-dependent helicase [Micrococcales bacterium]|nr:ATP-dependent helicase [Micrococcales bacterium]
MIDSDQIAALLGRPAPTPEQRDVVEAPLEPGLVVAGAGSGKTETMAGRVVWLLANALVAPDQVLGLTFTRKAAAELDQRVRARVRALVRAATVAGVDLPGRAALVGDVPSGTTDPADPSTALGDLARPTVATYHSYAASLVADHGLRLGLEPASRLLGEAAQYQQVARLVETWPDDLAVDAAVSTVVGAVIALSGALDEHLLDPAGADDVLARIELALGRPLAGTVPGEVRAVVASLGARRRLLPLVEAYRAAKRASAAIDYGDQVALAARLARQVPDVGAGERARFAVVLLDEYQDTSYAQVELLRALFGDGHPVTAVGDPHQSIYGWRGASAGGLARFPAAFPREDGTPAPVFRLATSWRNDTAVLAAANRTAAPLRASSPVVVPQLAARPGAGTGRVAAVVAETVADEAAVVAGFVAAARTRRAAAGRPTTAAVLCRKRAQFDLVAAALRDAGLAVQVVGLGGLLTSPEVTDLVAALRVAYDPSRGDAAMRLLTGARTRLGIADLHALAEWSAELAQRLGQPDDPLTRQDSGDGSYCPESSSQGRDALGPDETVSIVDAVDDPPPPGWTSRHGRSLTGTGRARVTELARVLAAVRALHHLALPDLVAHTERLLGLDIEVAAVPGATPGLARARLDAFVDVAARYAAAVEQPDLGGFLAWLEVAEREEDGLELPVVEPDPAAVQVATVHAAKGLEWDVVAVPGLVDGAFPAPAALRQDGPRDSGWLTALATLPYPARGDRDDLPALDTAGVTTGKQLAERLDRFAAANAVVQIAEERRLAYVAMTRARESLLLSAARWGPTKQPRAVSPFLTELADEGLVEVLGWVGEPEGDNPFTATPRTATWPADPFDPDPSDPDPSDRTSECPGPGGPHRRAAVTAAADAVLALLARHPQGPPPVPDDPDAALVTRLLAEEAARRAPVRTTELPAHLAASAMVRLAADQSQFALDLRRPVPTAPSDAVRRGTSFHAWVEAYYGRATLVDVDDLPGADDDSVLVDATAARLRTTFLTTPWAGLSPLALEQEVETSVAGITLRARIDAVFADPEDPGAVVVVDWKTGAPPTTARDRAARDVQLAVYRLAWSRRTGLPLDAVRAAFCYVATGQTVYPRRLLDEPGLASLLLVEA